MESISVITYRGFSTVNGETTLAQDMADIKNGKYARLIIKNCLPRDTGQDGRSQQRKETTAFPELSQQTIAKEGWHTALSATIQVITLRLDELEEDRLEAIRSLINNDPNSLRQLPVSQKAWLQNFRVQADRICMPATRKSCCKEK